MEIPPVAWPVFNARAAAVTMYCNGASYDDIKDETGLNDRNVRRIIDRCLIVDPSTGAIFGFYACVEGVRLHEYRRTAPFIAGATSFDAEGNVRKAGASGMMQLTLDAFPEVEKELKNAALPRDRDLQQVNIPTIDLREVFHDLLKDAFKKAGLDWKQQWPFTQRDGGVDLHGILTHPVQ